MRDSTHLKDDPDALRAVIAKDGYVLLRGILDRKIVLSAREVVIDALDKEWKLIDLKHDKLLAKIKDEQKGLLLTGFKSVTHHTKVQALLEGATLTKFFRQLFGSTPASFDNKWVRVHGKGEFTDEHTDYYRFQGTSKGMHTCWIPLGDYSVKDGTLAVCEGSHLLPGFEPDNYDSKTELPRSFQTVKDTVLWRSANFKAGDMVVFDIRTIHASTVNTSENFRISMDTRWQPSEYVSEKTRSMFKDFEDSD
eukprot:TRINITY_DN12696_c0_g1_i5.p1 TRINITY_DN12696_c0_g1~~TRINITY_DN12696_c0_g1_i5.p1  ORF type:complete len:276 (-),score=26.80 TRINITY_DN12696_c0_g1_i5:55-807(-)